MPRNTGTHLSDAHGNNRTATHLSTNIIIVVDGNPIGAIQTLDISEERGGGIKMIDELGTDGHIDSSPHQSTNYSITCQRVRFDNMRISEAFSRGFLHVKSQRIPFDIEIHDRFANADAGKAIITVLKNVWISKIGSVLSATDWIITDTMNASAEDIYSVLNDNNVAQSTANGRAHEIILNPFEQEADMGGQRGALDAAGLLDAFSQENI